MQAPISETVTVGAQAIRPVARNQAEAPGRSKGGILMQGWTQYFVNQPDFGMNYLMLVPDQCIYFLMLMWCLIVILSIRAKEPCPDEIEED